MGTTISSRCHRRVLWRSSEHREILLDGATGRFRRQTRSTFDAVAVAGVGLDQTGVDGKASPPTRPSAMQRCRNGGCARRSI
jgi:hypothetical protein